MYYNDSSEMIDLIDLIDFTLHEDFLQKWRHKYSEKFISAFQYKLLDSLSKRKPIKKSNLESFFKKKLKYSNEQIENFFTSIDVSLYYPIILEKWHERSKDNLNLPTPVNHYDHQYSIIHINDCGPSDGYYARGQRHK